MPVQLLSAAERDRAHRFPSAITDEDLITFFTLSEGDQKQIPVHAGPHARLGFALELCALRFMGFVPEDLTSAPPDAVTFVARQLAVEPGVLARYTGSAHTRMHHGQTIQDWVSSTVLPVTPWTSSGRLVRMTREGSRGATCRRGASQALTIPRLICVANRAMLDDCGEDFRVPSERPAQAGGTQDSWAFAVQEKAVSRLNAWTGGSR
jgi:hypothetical protein